MARMLNGLPAVSVSTVAGLTTGVMMLPLYLLVLIITRPGLSLWVLAAPPPAQPAVAAARAASAAAASILRPGAAITPLPGHRCRRRSRPGWCPGAAGP